MQYHHFEYDDVDVSEDTGLAVFTRTYEEEDDDGDLDTKVTTAVIPVMNITAFISHAPDDALGTTVLLDNGHWFLVTTDLDNANMHHYLLTKLTEQVQL